MLMLYFSGTGNSKYIAEKFAARMNAQCHSIEEKQDFDSLFLRNETVGFCYPVYGSRVPRIMREFVIRHTDALKGRKLIVFCTQLMFSGDGAAVFLDLLPKGHSGVLYAEHFNMPNNLCNFPLFKVTNGDENKKVLSRAGKKLEKACDNIEKGIVRKRGFNFLSRCLGLIQGGPFPAMETAAAGSAKTDGGCTGCGICVQICPMNNLELIHKRVVQKDNCTLCYRCVNACPEKAITVLIHKKPVKQYKGIQNL